MARKVSTRQSNAPIPVVIGAGITEQWYFYHLHDLLNVQLRIRPRYFGTEDIYQLDKKISQVVNEGATAICVFDADTAQVDEVQRQRIAALKAKYAGKKNVILCDSLPSIEFWFLIHYLDTNRHFPNSHAVERELRNFIAQYEKTEPFLKNRKWVEDLVAGGKLDTAVTRAKHYEITGGSYSNIYKAIEQIKDNQPNKNQKMPKWIYNRNGRAVALDCEDCVYDSNGYFRLWILGNNLYNMNGHHVGWVEGGVFYDSDNRVLGFTRDHSQSLPSTPGISGTPGYPGMSGRPGRPGFSGVPGRPGYSGWSSILMEDYINR